MTDILRAKEQTSVAIITPDEPGMLISPIVEASGIIGSRLNSDAKEGRDETEREHGISRDRTGR